MSGGGPLAALSRLARPCGVYTYCVMTRPLVGEPLAAPPGIDLRILDEGALLPHCGNPGLELSQDKAKAAFSRGETCIGALCGRTLVGYAWFAYEPAPHVSGIWMDFDRTCIYTYRAFVRPGYRGRGIAPALYRFGDALFLDRGRTQAIVCIEAHNRRSLAAAERSGARPVGYAAYLQAGNVFLSMRTPGVRRAGYRFYRPQRDANHP